MSAVTDRVAEAADSVAGVAAAVADQVAAEAEAIADHSKSQQIERNGLREMRGPFCLPVSSSQ